MQNNSQQRVSNFLCSPHGISVALNIGIVFIIKEYTSKIESNKLLTGEVIIDFMY